MQIIILGEECPECDDLEERVGEALALLGVTDAEVEHIWDVREEVETFGVEKVPALVVDGTLVYQGDAPLPDAEEIAHMISDAEDAF